MREELTENQIKILRAFREQTEDDLYYSYGYLDIDLDIKTLKKEMRRLRELGLVDFQRGLMTEDGEVAGSGHQIPYGRREEVDDLLSQKEGDK